MLVNVSGAGYCRDEESANAAWNKLRPVNFSPEGARPKERASPLSLAPCPISASSDNHPTAEEVPSCNELHFRCRVDLLSWKRGSFDAPPFAPSWENNIKGRWGLGKSRSLYGFLKSQETQKSTVRCKWVRTASQTFKISAARSARCQIGQTLENRIKASCRSCSRVSSLRCF